jgi:hypothetical protein
LSSEQRFGPTSTRTASERLNPSAPNADTCRVPYQQESSYFVRLDAPPPSSRHTPLEREPHWEEPESPGRRSVRPVEPARKRKRHSFSIRPAGLLLLAVLTWVAWAYTTPGGPSARINDWIDHTRTDVADVSLGPGLHKTANYFNQLYATQGSYPHMSDSEVEQDPNAGFGINQTYTWCAPSAVVLTSNGAGGSVSRLLLSGKDLGNVNGVYGCPGDLSKPAPWTVSK